MRTLDFERETLRNLAGPELVQETGLDLLDREELAGINGGVAVAQPPLAFLAAGQVTLPLSGPLRESQAPITLPV